MKDKPKIQIQFPNLLMIPIIAIIGSILKVFGLTQYDWLHIILIIPSVLYFAWCVGYCMLAIASIMLIKIISKK